MSVTFTTVPAKRLAESITGASATFKVNNIKGWDGNNLTSADFGTRLWAVFRNSAATLMEIMEVDPASITSASSPITIIARGLKFNGDQSTSVAANKLTWVKGDTVIELGTHVPQLLESTVRTNGAQTIDDIKTFSSLPRSTAGYATTGTELVTYAQALALATGTANINRIVLAGTAGETLVAGNIVYLKISDNRWYKASSAAAATAENLILGIAQGAGTVGNAITSGVLISGLDSNQTGLTANSLYYLSTAGGVSLSAGTKSVQLGLSQSTTSILFLANFNLYLTQDQQNALAGNNVEIAVGTGNKLVTQTGLQHGAEKYVLAASASSTAYTGTYSPAPTSITNGMEFFLKIDVANTTTTPTFNPNGLGAKTIVKGTNTALVANDLIIGQIARFIYDGTNMVLQNPSTVAAAVGSYVGVPTSGSGIASANTDVVHTPGFQAKNITIYYKIDGIIGGTAGFAWGIAIFNGTSIVSNMIFQANTAGGTTSTTYNNTSFGTAAPVGGNVSGAGNNAGVTISVLSVTATQFTIRAALVSANSFGANFSYFVSATV